MIIRMTSKHNNNNWIIIIKHKGKKAMMNRNKSNDKIMNMSKIIKIMKSKQKTSYLITCNQGMIMNKL